MKEEPLVLTPECAEAHDTAVKVHTAENIIAPDGGLFPMEALVRVRFVDGSVTSWVRTALQSAEDERVFEFNVLKKCEVIGYDYSPIFVNRKRISSAAKVLLPGDMYTLTWTFNLT